MAENGATNLTGQGVTTVVPVVKLEGRQNETPSQCMLKSTCNMTGSTTIAALVSNLSTLVNNSVSMSTKGPVTAFISSRPNINISAANNITHIAKPVMVAHGSKPLLLPKPNVQQKQLTCTPPKYGFSSNNSLLSSPLNVSPSQQLSCQGASPLQNRKRGHADIDSDPYDSKRRRTPNRCGPEKGGKGLRHFSMKVCEKVQQKGVTSYNEVADELVQEFSEQSTRSITSNTDQSYDQKNIRRRVYDALNVLMAMNIISKEKKEIKWVGLPTNSAQECKQLEEQKGVRIERIKQKQQKLKELIIQQIVFKNLLERNKVLGKKNGPPQSNACIHLPFIIVNTSKKTVIDCSISSDKSEYLFNFDEAFEIHDDIEVLKRMGLTFGLEKGECNEKNLRVAKCMVPKALTPYINQMANGSYGNIDLLETSGNKNDAHLQSPGPSTRKQYARTRKNHVMASSDGSENDGDDEHTIVE